MEKKAKNEGSSEENQETLSENVNSDSNTGKVNESDCRIVDTPCHGDVTDTGEMADASEKATLENAISPLSDGNIESQADGKTDNDVREKANMEGEDEEIVSARCLIDKDFESGIVSVIESESKCHGNYTKGNENCSAIEKEKELESEMNNKESEISHAIGSSCGNDVTTKESASNMEESLSPEIGYRKKNSCSVLSNTLCKSPVRRKLKVHVFERELIDVKSSENHSEPCQNNDNIESMKNPTWQIIDKSQGSLSNDIVIEPLSSSSRINQTGSQSVYSGEGLEVSSNTTEAANMPPTEAKTEFESLKNQSCSPDLEVLASEDDNLIEIENEMSVKAAKASTSSDNEEDSEQNFEGLEENLSANPIANQVFGNKKDMVKVGSNLINSKDESSDILKPGEGCTDLAVEKNEVPDKASEGELLSDRKETVCSLSEESLGKGDSHTETVKGRSKVSGPTFSLVDESYCSSEDDEENVGMSAVVGSPKMISRDLDQQVNETEKEMISDYSVHGKIHKEGILVDDKARGIADGEKMRQTEIGKDKHSVNICCEDVEVQKDFIRKRGTEAYQEKFEGDQEDKTGDKKSESRGLLAKIENDSDYSVQGTQEYQEKDAHCYDTRKKIGMDLVMEALDNNSPEHIETKERILGNTSEEVRMDGEEAVSNEAEDCKEIIDKSSENTQEVGRMDMNAELEDCQKRDDKNSKNRAEEIKMYDEKEALNNESNNFKEKEDKFSRNSIEDNKTDAEKVLNDELEEYQEREDKRPGKTNYNSTMHNEKEVLNEKSEEYHEKEEIYSKASVEEVILDVEKDTLNKNHGSQGKYVKADRSSKVKDKVISESVCHGKCDEDISEPLEGKHLAYELDSEGKVSNDTPRNSKTCESMPQDEILEAQNITQQSKILENQPPHNVSQEYSNEMPSGKKIHFEEMGKELSNNATENIMDSQEEYELVIDEGCEKQENVILTEGPESQKDNGDKDCIGKSENVLLNDLVNQQKSGENSCEKLQTETAPKDIEEMEKSGICCQNLQVTSKAGNNDDLQPEATESKQVKSDSKAEGEDCMKKKQDSEVHKHNTSKNTDTEVHQVDTSKPITCELPFKKVRDVSAITPNSKRKAVAQDEEGFSPQAKVSRNASEQSEATKTGQKLPSNLQDIECVASGKDKGKVQCIDLSSDEEDDSLGLSRNTKPKVCHKCCDIWNDEVLRLIFKGTECVTVNSKITYGAIVLITNWINRNVSGDKKTVITSVFERADLGKNIAKLNISKLDHWLDQLLSNETIKCCDVFTAVYSSDKKLEQPTLSKSKQKNRKASVMPSPSSKPSQKKIAPSISQNVDMQKNISLVPINTLSPSKANPGVKLHGAAPSEKITPQSSVASGNNMLPNVIRLGTPVSVSGLPIHLPLSSSQPNAFYLVDPSLGHNVGGLSDLSIATPSSVVTPSLMTPMVAPSIVSATGDSSFNPQIGNIISMANSSSGTEDLVGNTSDISTLPGKPLIKIAERTSSNAGNKAPLTASDTEVNIASRSVESTSRTRKTSKKSLKRITTVSRELLIKTSPKKMDKLDVNTNTNAINDKHFSETPWDGNSGASNEMPADDRNYNDTKNIMTNNVDIGKSKNTENLIQRDAGIRNQSLLETLCLDLNSTNIYMLNISGSPITNEALLKNPSALKEKNSDFSGMMPAYFSVTKEHSALHEFAKEAFNILIFEPHNFRMEKDGKLKSNRYVTKRELLTLQNMCILNAENPDANLFYEIFLQILLSRNQVLLIPDSRTLLLVTEEIRKEYNRARAKDASIQILNEDWDTHNLYCAEDVLLCKGDVTSEPTVRDLLIVFCTWKNLKKNFPDPEFDRALQVFCKSVDTSNIDKVGVCVQFYVKYCRYLYEEKDKALTRACLDHPIHSSKVVSLKKNEMAARAGQTALDRLSADEKEIERYIDRCKELQKAAMDSPNQQVYENLCDEMIKLKVKLKNFTAVNDLMKKRIQAVEARRGSVVKMVKHPQGKYLMRKLRNSIESTHKLFLKRCMDDHTDNNSAKRQKTMSNGNVSCSKVSEDEVVSPQIQTLIKNLLYKGVKPEQVKTVIRTVLVNFERKVPVNLPSEIWIKNFAKIISACNR